MYVEAFTAAKDPRRPDLNEDRLVVHGTELFAVLDGVTDKSGRRYGGRTGGRLAGALLDGALRALVDEGAHLTLGAHEVTARLTDAIRAAYRRFGIDDEARADPHVRFAANGVVVFAGDDRYRVLQVGDCGLRVDGGEPRIGEHPLDGVLGRVRGLVHAALPATIADPDERLRLARLYTVEGLAERPAEAAGAVSAEEHDAIARHVLAELPRSVPDLDGELARTVARLGIRGTGRHRNRSGPLGHGVLDGFEVPDEFVIETWLDAREVSTLELFSDGYFGWPDRSGTVAAWEDHLAAVERDDPHRLHSVPSTKGSGAGTFADDRTVLILRRNATHHDAA